MDLALYFSLWIASLPLALLAYAMARAVRAGELPLNSMLGIRTKHTMQSEAIWCKAHLAAVGWMRASACVGLVSMVISMLLLVGFAGLGSEYPHLLFLVPLTGWMLQVGVLLGAAFRANRVAKASVMPRCDA